MSFSTSAPLGQPSSPTLTWIERLWKHRKSRYLHNEFFGTDMDLLQAAESALNPLSDDISLATGIEMERNRTTRTS